jgi:hypothetical protein
MVPVAVREDRAVAADIEATAKALYDSKGKPHGRFVDDTSRPGIRIYRSFEWEELTTIAKATFRVHARAILTVQLAGSASAEPTEARMREALLKIACGAEEMVYKWPDVTGDIFNLIAKEARAALSESPVRAEPEPSHELLAYFREDRRRLAEGLRDATNYLRLATMWTVDSDLHAKLKHAHSRARAALSECPVPVAPTEGEKS